MGRDRLGVATLSALLILAALVAVTASVGGASGVDRAGVNTLLDEAPKRLRLAAVVIVSAVRDFGTARELDIVNGSAIAEAPFCLRSLLVEPGGLAIGDGLPFDPPSAPLAAALRPIPPPMA